MPTYHNSQWKCSVDWPSHAVHSTVSQQRNDSAATMWTFEQQAAQLQWFRYKQTTGWSPCPKCSLAGHCHCTSRVCIQTKASKQIGEGFPKHLFTCPHWFPTFFFFCHSKYYILYQSYHTKQITQPTLQYSSFPLSTAIPHAHWTHMTRDRCATDFTNISCNKWNQYTHSHTR